MAFTCKSCGFKSPHKGDGSDLCMSCFSKLGLMNDEWRARVDRQQKFRNAWHVARCFVELAQGERRYGRRAGPGVQNIPFDTLVSRFEAYAFLGGVR